MMKIILPSLPPEQVDYLINEAVTVRDRAIINLFADSGIRLTELLSEKEQHIDLDKNTIIILDKCGKQRKAPFTSQTFEFLREWLRFTEVSKVNENMYISNVWGLRKRNLQIMFLRPGILYEKS